MADKIIVKESAVTREIMKALDDMDADSFARVAGEVLGGKCYVIDFSGMGGKELMYEFTPDENYGGAFDKIKKA